jgi:hypothetical protein
MSYKSNNERRRTRKLKPEPFRPVVGKRYHVRGYHTGDFTGNCIQVFRLTSVFQVVEKRIGAALELGQLVEVPLSFNVRLGISEAQF